MRWPIFAPSSTRKRLPPSSLPLPRFEARPERAFLCPLAAPAPRGAVFRGHPLVPYRPRAPCAWRASCAAWRAAAARCPLPDPRVNVHSRMSIHSSLRVAPRGRGPRPAGCLPSAKLNRAIRSRTAARTPAPRTTGLSSIELNRAIRTRTAAGHSSTATAHRRPPRRPPRAAHTPAGPKIRRLTCNFLLA